MISDRCLLGPKQVIWRKILRFGFSARRVVRDEAVRPCQHVQFLILEKGDAQWDAKETKIDRNVLPYWQNTTCMIGMSVLTFTHILVMEVIV